jgi:hypothetical protein
MAIGDLNSFFRRSCRSHGLSVEKRAIPIIVPIVAVGAAVAIPVFLGGIKLYIDILELQKDNERLYNRIERLENDFAITNATYQVNFVLYFYFLLLGYDR